MKKPGVHYFSTGSGYSFSQKANFWTTFFWTHYFHYAQMTDELYNSIKKEFSPRLKDIREDKRRGPENPKAKRPYRCLSGTGAFSFPGV